MNGSIHGQFVAPPIHEYSVGNDALVTEAKYNIESDDSTPRLLHRIQQNESILALAVSKSLGLIYAGSGSGEVMVRDQPELRPNLKVGSG